MKRILSLIVVTLFIILTLCACGNKDTDSSGSAQGSTGNQSAGSFDDKVTANEDYFEWDGNLITAVTSEGSKQKSILIPARCEGFAGVTFQNTEIEHVAFEDDDDIALDFAFMGAKNVISVKLPSNLTSIPSMSFQMCEQLKEIVIPASVSTLESYAFSSCDNLTSVEFAGEGIATIGDNCFEGCKTLKKVTIPNGVTSIGKYAFFECSSLSDVELSATVNSIAKFAFGNTAITEITFPEEIEFTTMDTSAFGTNAYTTVVYIVKGSWCDNNQSSWNIGFSEVKYK